jgi:exosortase/archaeosortase family protein
MNDTIEANSNLVVVGARPTSSPTASKSGWAWYALWAVQFLLLLVPAVTTICSEITKRSFNDNFIQLVTAIVGTVGAWHLCKSGRQVDACSSVLGAVALGAMAIVSFLAVLLHMITLYEISVIAMVGLFVLAVRGAAKFKHYLPLILFAFFLIPDMPDEVRLKISLPMQMITTKGTVALAHLFIPISSIGHTFIVNGHPFDVAPGCSGLNMWISFLFAFGIWQLFERFRPKDYAIMCVCIGLTTMVLNVVRLFITALVAYYVSAGQALAIHTNLEAVLVPLGLIFLFYLGGRLRGGEQTTAA